MLLRVWDNTVSYVETDYLHGEYLYPYHGTVNERSLQTWENGRTYSCSGSQGRLAYVYETWGSQYAYYFMYEYPPCSSEADSAYYAIFLAFLNRLSCDTEFVDEDPDYILPQSAQRRLTEDDLSGLTHEELCLARNEIYARHGRRFKNQNIASYFESKAGMSALLTRRRSMRTRAAISHRMSSTTRPSYSTTKSRNLENRSIDRAESGKS